MVTATSGQGAAAVFLSKHACEKTLDVLLNRLQALDGFDTTAADAIKCCLTKHHLAVQQAAEVANAVAKQHRAVGLRQAPNVPQGTCGAVAALTFRHTILVKAMEQLAGRQQKGSIATEAQLTGTKMLQLLAPALHVLEAVKMQLDTRLANYTGPSGRLASVMQLLGACAVDHLTRTCAATRERRVELQVALLCLGVEANRVAGGECSVCPMAINSLPVGGSKHLHPERLDICAYGNIARRAFLICPFESCPRMVSALSVRRPSSAF